MPFRRASRRAPRFHRKKRTNFRRSFRGKSMRRSSRKTMRPSTSKDKTIVTDRKFVNFKYVTVTNGGQVASDGAFGKIPDLDGYGMIPIQSDTTDAPDHQMFVFSPNYTSGTFDPSTCLALPGNSLALLDVSGAFPLYSDTFKQTCPTGVNQWANFYENYICHGSSVEVTLVDSEVPGQLLVMPVTDDAQDSLDANYTFNFSNMLRIVTFSAVPDEQAYARIKLVSSTGGMDKVRIKHKMLTKKLFDIKTLRDDALNKADLNTAGSTIPANPGNQWSWLISFLPNLPIEYGASTPVVQVTVQVKIVYHCELLDRRELDFTTQ